MNLDQIKEMLSKRTYSWNDESPESEIVGQLQWFEEISNSIDIFWLNVLSERKAIKRFLEKHNDNLVKEIFNKALKFEKDIDFDEYLNGDVAVEIYNVGNCSTVVLHLPDNNEWDDTEDAERFEVEWGIDPIYYIIEKEATPIKTLEVLNVEIGNVSCGYPRNSYTIESLFVVLNGEKSYVSIDNI